MDIIINASGDSFTYRDGQLWYKNPYFMGGEPESFDVAMVNTSDDLIQPLERSLSNFFYEMENSSDRVKEDQLAVDDLDILSEVGGQKIAITKTIDNFTVMDGLLNFNFLTSMKMFYLCRMIWILDVTL